MYVSIETFWELKENVERCFNMLIEMHMSSYTFEVYVSISVKINVPQNFLQISVSDLGKLKGKCELLWHLLRLDYT